MTRPTIAALVLLAASVTSAAEIIVFKKDSPFKGGAIRVDSHEEKGGRLWLRREGGDVFTVAPSSVDWELSRLATEQHLARETAQAERVEAERRAVEARKVAAPGREISVVEASRRFGVENPGMSYADGSAGREVQRTTAPVAAAKPATATPSPSGAAKAGREKVEAAQAERDAVAKDLDAQRADNNPDPLWAAKRESKIRALEAQLAQADRKLAEAKRAEEGAKSRPGASPAPR